MALYKNRQVNILGPNVMANSPDSINVSYENGSHENVATAEVLFTEDEKNALIKKYPSRYQDVKLMVVSPIESPKVGKPKATVE